MSMEFMTNTRIPLGGGYYVYASNMIWYLGREFSHRGSNARSLDLPFPCLYTLLVFLVEHEARFSGAETMPDLLAAICRVYEKLDSWRDELQKMR